MKIKRLFLFAFLILFLSSSGFSWLAGYAKRKEITVQGANLDSNQTHYPLYVYVVDADIDDECDDDGDRSFDIRFTQSDDSVLDVDWIDYSEAAGSATIICFVSDAGWTIESDGSTTFYIYYGNAAAGDPGTDEGVWDASFKAVYHLEEAANPYLDATANSHDSSAGTYPTQAGGKVNNGQDFEEGSTEYIDVTHHADFHMTGDATISAWINLESYSSDAIREIFSKMGASSSDREWKLTTKCNFDGNAYQMQASIWTDGGTWLQANEPDYPRSITTWYHVSARFDQTADELYLYVNGGEEANDVTTSGAQNVTGTEVQQIGSREGGNKYFDGILDEIRFSSTDRGVDWLNFEYYNINEADAELSWAGEESEPSDDFVPKIIWIWALCLCVNFITRKKYA